jgi:hypothetical protein
MKKNQSKNFFCNVFFVLFEIFVICDVILFDFKFENVKRHFFIKKIEKTKFV